MPELPEVETVRRGLERLIVGKKILAVESSYPRMILTGYQNLQKALKNQEIKGISRRGKYLIFEIGADLRLISHLRMEGKYRLEKLGLPLEKHDHIAVKFSDSQLIYSDVRKFGTWELLPESELSAYFASRKLGPEPTFEDFDEEIFRAQLKKSSKKIKPYLLEQTLVVGLGNIYVDEVLWSAQIHPETISSKLTKKKIHVLHDAIIEILQKAVELGGSTIRTYSNALGTAGSMQNELKVYGKTGENCPRCATEIQKIKVAGRGTHFCPKCQKI